MATALQMNLGTFVAAAWALFAEEHHKLADRDGAIDRAIQACSARLEELFGDQLTFSVTSVGFRCLDWPDAFLFMQEALLADVDGSTFTTIQVRMDVEDATCWLLGFGLDPNERLDLCRSFCETYLKETDQLISA